MRIQRFETKVTASYTTDTARRQITAIQAKYNDITSIQTKLLASSRLTAGFTQNTMRDLLEMAAPVPVVYTTAKLLTAVKVAKKDEKAADKPAAKAPKKQSDAKALFEQMKKAGAFDGNKTETTTSKPTGGAKATPEELTIQEIKVTKDAIAKVKKDKSLSADEKKEDIAKLQSELETLESELESIKEKSKAKKPGASTKKSKFSNVEEAEKEALSVIDRFANTYEAAGDNDSTSDKIDQARTNLENLSTADWPELEAAHNKALKDLYSVKTPRQLETFLATESEKLRGIVLKDKDQTAKSEKPTKSKEIPIYHKNKFLDLLADLETAEDTATESGAKLTSFKTLVQNSFEEMYQEALGFGPDEFKVLVKEAKDSVESAGNVKKVVEESRAARSKISSYIDEEVRQGRLKDSGRQEPTAAVPEKEPDIEAAKEQLQYFTTALASAPKTLPKGFMATKLYPILDKIVGHVPSLKNFAEFFKTEMGKQEKPTTKILKALGGTLVEELTKNLSEPDEPVDDSIVEDPNDFSVDDAGEEPTGFEFPEDETAEPAAEPTGDSEGKTGFEMDDEPVQDPTPAATKSPRRVLDDDVEETPEPATTEIEDEPRVTKAYLLVTGILNKAKISKEDVRTLLENLQTIKTSYNKTKSRKLIMQALDTLENSVPEIRPEIESGKSELASSPERFDSVVSRIVNSTYPKFIDIFSPGYSDDTYSTTISKSATRTTEKTPEPAAAPVEAPKPAAPPAAKSRVRAPAQTKVAPAAQKPVAPPITEQQAAKPTPGQFDVSGQDGDLQLKPTSVKLDPANKQLIQKHQALAKDLNSLFYELQTVAARVNTSLTDSVPPKTIEAIQSSLGRLGEQVKISMLASLKAIREMTAAHIPKTFADTVKNLNSLLVKTIPTKIPPAVHTFMFIDEDDELCFTSYIVLTRPTDKQGRTIPRLFIYLTYRTQKHKMYVCTSRNMLPLSEDLFRMPFTSPKTMAIGLDRLLSLDNFHSNLAKVDLRTVFGKGGVESAAIINDFPAISSIEQDGEELVFALSDAIGEGQEALVERQANQLENRLKLGLSKKFRIFKTYKFVTTAINQDDVYSDPADNKTAEPKTTNKPTPHFEIRLSFTAVPGAEPITTADLDFLKDRFIKLNDDAIRRMVRIANES